MSDQQQRERLYKAFADSMSRTKPELHPHVRQRVLSALGRAERPRAFSASYAWALGGFALAVSLAVGLLLRTPAAPGFQVAGHSGEVGAWLTAAPARPLSLRFAGGTQVSLTEGSRGRVTQVTGSGAHIELANGTVGAEVTQRPGADWTFDAGPFEVAVTGTQLQVSWQPDSGQFEVAVTHGSVVVNGPVIQGPQAVRAGQVCRVDMKRRLMELAQLGVEHAPSATRAPEPQVTAQLEPSAAPAAVEPTLPQTSSSAGLPRAASAESLLEVARAARLAGRPDEERAALLACRKRAPGQAPAAQAAYLLGRASGPAEAAEWFEAYLREQPQGLLAREASGRLIETYRASGNTSAAQKAAARYLARYPNGPHASLARQAVTPRGGSQD